MVNEDKYFIVINKILIENIKVIYLTNLILPCSNYTDDINIIHLINVQNIYFTHEDYIVYQKINQHFHVSYHATINHNVLHMLPVILFLFNNWVIKYLTDLTMFQMEVIVVVIGINISIARIYQNMVDQDHFDTVTTDMNTEIDLTIQIEQFDTIIE